MKPVVKVCGMTREQDAALCETLGASLLGFIFHPGSPRNVSVDFAASIKTATARKTGVFVKQSASEVLKIMSMAGLHYAQLHGGQNVEFCKAIGPDRVIKVLWPQKYESVIQLQTEIDRFAPHCRYLLFDAGKSGGGHGTSLDLNIFTKINIPCEWFIAGGINPDNICQVLEAVEPDGVDINSGVEAEPGIKDKNKLQTVFELLNG
ncbi:phosphoribosylanthranilate isomerase [Maridesulfovibrio bastinii]|uniref:phosphoribosylanthranilate isomerase n=1 Tax=Maridesulfovibrio bastinii TaxID=47157 RepID=UPI000418FBBF|nr:phosphoribosylanthranilate isomerase [Maridesulfovibrio bastinii]